MTPSTPTSLDQYENALIQYLKRTRTPTLAHVRTIWGWRCDVDPEYVHLSDLAAALWPLCERLNLLGHSLGSFPGGRGGFGVVCDAAPEREWALLLVESRTPLDSPERVYWFRIVSVLCSRLHMARVADLPGYNGEAKDGPFRYDGQGGVIEVLPEEWDEDSRRLAQRRAQREEVIT